jgi:hypothetical protein
MSTEVNGTGNGCHARPHSNPLFNRRLWTQQRTITRTVRCRPTPYPAPMKPWLTSLQIDTMDGTELAEFSANKDEFWVRKIFSEERRTQS